MRIHDVIIVSLGNVRRRSSRAVLTMLGIAIGISVIFFLISLGYGLQRMLLMRITTETTLRTLDVASPSVDKLPLTRKQLAEFDDQPGVEFVSPRSSQAVSVRYNTLNSETTLRMVDKNYPELAGLVLSQGQFSGKPNAVVISPTLAELLGLSDADIVGANITVTFDGTQEFQTEQTDTDIEEIESVSLSTSLSASAQPKRQTYTIVGVLGETSIENEMYHVVSSSAMIPEPFETLKVSVDSPDMLSGIRDKFVADGYLVSSLSDTADQANKVFRILRIILGIFGIFSLLVAAVGLLNTMTIAFLERTNDIGIMRAIGASRRDIRIIFLVESTLIGFAGGIVGVILGFIATGLFSLVLLVVSKSLGGGALAIFYTPPWFILFILITSLIVGFLSGVFPARRAASLNTLAALRYK
jgi:putative ABC transport system permease protein